MQRERKREGRLSQQPAQVLARERCCCSGEKKQLPKASLFHLGLHGD